MRPAAALLLLGLTLPAVGEGLREIEPIIGTRPQQPADVALPLSVPVDRIEHFVRDLAAAWPSQDLAGLLSEDFPDRERLIEELQHRLPIDARLHVLSVGAVQTLSQEVLSDGRVSEVLVRVNGEVEFSDAQGRLQRLPTRQEWILRVAQRLP